MKRVLSKIKYVFIAGVLFCSQGCELDMELNDRYTDVSIYQNPENMDLIMYGMYNEFKTFAFGQFPIGYDNNTDGLTDILKYTSSAEGMGSVNRLASEPSRISASSPNLNYWNSAYTRIRRINEFLDGMNKYANLSEEQELLFEAEARFIRGYVYFWLVKLHGSVVLLDQLAFDKDNPRSSEEESWNFAIEDFAFAAEHLPEQWDAAEKGRATKGAAYAMLARTALYAGSIAEYDNKEFNSDPLTGVPSAKKDTYYQLAADAAAEVMKLGYSLHPDFTELFTTADNNEAIFSLDFQRPTVTHNYDRRFAPPSDVPGYGAEGVPTAELVDAFEMADGKAFSWSNPSMAANPYASREPRFYGTILYNGAEWKGKTLETFVGGEEGFIDYGVDANPHRTVTGYYVRKYLDESNQEILKNGSSQRWMVIRYAEVQLIYAEAQAKLGNLQEAKSAINELRGRVGLPGTKAATAPELMEVIEQERMVELAFEGHRYWDLRRWRKAHMVLDNRRVHGHKITQAEDGTFRYEEVDSDKQDKLFPGQIYYIPIPQAEIANNPAVEQIQGW